MKRIQSSIKTLSRFYAADTTIEYQLDQVTGLVGLSLYPTALKAQLTPCREWLTNFEIQRMGKAAPKMRARPVDSLVQVKCVGDDYPAGFSQGSSLRNSATTLGMKYQRQDVTHGDKLTTVTTFLRDAHGRAAEHRLQFQKGEPTLEITTTFRNESPQSATLELLSSFSIGDLTPFHPADAPNRLRIHRLRSAWSAEGRLESRTVEELNLERSWLGNPVRCERFGQAGSMPVKGYFPFAAVEDVEAHVCWGAQIAWAGSWQMEFYRQSDALCLSGGIADREYGHWTKILAPGESIVSPPAVLACVFGDLDALCQRLAHFQQRAADRHPVIEAALPVICNEYCTTWGDPTHSNLEALAKRLKGSPVRYLVIDAGWYGDLKSGWWNAQGDWEPSRQRFPDGLGATAHMIREHGLIPGLWFEMEVAGPGSAAFALTTHQLTRDGAPVTTPQRHFWDFRDPWVHDYLAARVISLLRDGGFGYVKFDYNETIGIGVDGAESLGEGLRAHILALGNFYDRIRAELPDLVIENCSSGGHRLEPSMIARSAMSSFSDAHESPEIPIIAANLQRIMLPRQSQIWAVLRATDDRRRLVYSLAATFLGRMCVSGDLHDLSGPQWELAIQAMEFYGRVAPIIKHGNSRRFGPVVPSYRHPEGWQAILRVGETGREALVVTHAFGNTANPKISIPLPKNINWRVEESFSSGSIAPKVTQHSLILRLEQFEAAVIHLGAVKK